MRFAVAYNPAVHGVDPDALVAYARHAEACGFEGLYLPEHVALSPDATIGSFRLPATLPFLDPLDALGFVAAATDRLLLGTAVLLVPYHHPVTLAKRLATLDVLSKGRMRLLTVGLGALPGEAAAVGVDYASRGRRADEAIDVLRLLWTGDENGVRHHGEFFDLDAVCSFPQPIGGPLPVHVAGSSAAAARRAGRRGDGWFPGGALAPAERAAQFELARAAARDAGRDPDRLEYTRTASIGVTAEQVCAYAAQGVTRLVVSATSADPGDRQDELTSFAERVGLDRASPREATGETRR